jgi:hypothetical protein
LGESKAATKDVTLKFQIISKSEERRQVFGWAYVSKDRDGKQVQDFSGDIVHVDELEKAAYGFLKDARVGGEMHEGDAPNQLIASLVFTEQIQKALGIPEGTLPQGWFVGFEVTPETFAKVKGGSLLCFSIEGQAIAEDAA